MALSSRGRSLLKGLGKVYILTRVGLGATGALVGGILLMKGIRTAREYRRMGRGQADSPVERMLRKR